MREGAEIHEREAMEAAARQYVRKVSGFREPSQANHEVFEAAIEAIAAATESLMLSLQIRV